VLARGNCQLVSITVEGKVSEEFGEKGETISQWRKYSKSESGDTRNKEIRLKCLLGKLELEDNNATGEVKYQLLHRTASAVIESERWGAKRALMLVHSFSQTNEHFGDYQQFVRLFGVEARPDCLAFAKNIRGIALYFAWAEGDEKYLKC